MSVSLHWMMGQPLKSCPKFTRQAWTTILVPEPNECCSICWEHYGKCLVSLCRILVWILKKWISLKYSFECSWTRFSSMWSVVSNAVMKQLQRTQHFLRERYCFLSRSSWTVFTKSTTKLNMTHLQPTVRKINCWKQHWFISAKGLQLQKTEAL